MEKSKPVNTHMKPALACAALIIFALGYSWAVPIVHVSCIRIGDRVECQVQRKLIGLITYSTTRIDDLKAVGLRVEQGTRSSATTETTDAAYLTLVDAEGVEKSFLLESFKEMGTARNKTFAEGIENFLRSDEPTFSNWTVSLIGYGAFVLAALGFLFLGLVTWDFIGTRVRAFRSMSKVD